MHFKGPNAEGITPVFLSLEISTENGRWIPEGSHSVARLGTLAEVRADCLQRLL